MMKELRRQISGYLGRISINDSRLAGILGTVIFHLVAAIIFMLFQVRSLQRENLELIAVEFEPEEELIKEEQPDLKLTPIEKILQGDEEMLNIARNLANRNDQSISREEYIDMVKEEMIKKGLLGVDNYIDEQKRQAEMGEEKLAMENEKPETKDPDKPTEAQKMAASFKGPTRIYYDLEGRNHTYLPIPIYKCEGAGKIVLSIEVSLKGIVEDASVIPEQSTTTNQCLIETALSAAMISRFNPDVKAPKTQKGTLTYHFVAQ